MINRKWVSYLLRFYSYDLCSPFIFYKCLLLTDILNGSYGCKFWFRLLDNIGPLWFVGPWVGCSKLSHELGFAQLLSTPTWGHNQAHHSTNKNTLLNLFTSHYVHISCYMGELARNFGHHSYYNWFKEHINFKLRRPIACFIYLKQMWDFLTALWTRQQKKYIRLGTKSVNQNRALLNTPRG